MEPVSWVRVLPLGKGSYGTFHLTATNIPSHPLIAVKSSELAFSETLQKEDFILSDLDGCPEVVGWLGSETTIQDGGGRVWFNLLLEYASGGTLSDIIKNRGGRLSEPEIRCFTRMLLKGLRTIHASGYVHCDLKPANILAFPSKTIGGVTQLKIADFGLAKLPGELRKSGSKFRGTPLYMSPESVGDGLILPALDVWSLGCVVVEMFTGRAAMECHEDFDHLAYDLIFMEKMAIPETMSFTGRDFLSKCFDIDPWERWNVEMLLRHPFICHHDSAPTIDTTGDLSCSALPPHLMAIVAYVLDS